MYVSKAFSTALVCAAVLGAACSDQSPTATDAEHEVAAFGHNAQGDAEIGTTLGWFNGKTVEFFYNKNFFCKEPPESDAPSSCTLGAEPVVKPRGGNIPVLYVMTPLGFTPQEQLQCPTATCINHPHTIDVTPVQSTLESVLGAMLPGDGVIPTPAHSHIVDRMQGGWWEIEVIGVTDEGVWNQIAAAKSLDKVRQLQNAGVGITGDIPTNLYLFFSVRPNNS